MKLAYVSFAAAVFAGLGGCTPEPYVRIKGKVSPAIEAAGPVFGGSGLRLNIKTGCRASIAERWCSSSDPECKPVIKYEPAECLHEVAPNKFALRTPWGQVYPGVLADGVLDVKIDWKSTNAEPLAELDLAALRTEWVINSEDGSRDVHTPLELSDDELHAMLAVIRDATGNDYNEAPASEHAALRVALTNQPSISGDNSVALSVTNSGPDPAYRVVAHLKIGSTMSREVTIPFGRIDRGETRTKAKNLAVPNETNELNPKVYAKVIAANAPTASWSGNIQLLAKRTRAVPPQLSCTSSDKIPAAGQRLRVECVASNPGDRPAQGLRYEIAIDKATPEPAKGPGELGPHTQPKFELTPMLPANAPVGSSVGITVTMNAPGGSPVQQQISVDIVPFDGLCKPGLCTSHDYRSILRRLQEGLTAGTFTQAEFDSYKAELDSCMH